MSEGTTRLRIANMWNGITGVRTHYYQIPMALKDAELPGVVIFPGAATYETLRVSLEGTTATFFRNGVKVGTAMISAITPNNVFFTPVIAAFSHAAATRVPTADYVLIESTRVAP